MAVTDRGIRLVEDLRAQLDTVVDGQVRDLVRAWATAWDEVAPDLRAALLDMLVANEPVTRSQLLRSERLRRALAVIADQLQALADSAGVRVTSDLAAVVETAGAAQASVIDSQLPPGFMRPAALASWSRVDENQIAAIVTRSTQQITSLARPLSAEAYAAVRRELIRGVAAGSNPRATAERIVRRAEGRFNGGLSRALNIARTETLDAHRAAAQVGQAQHADVLTGWQWLCKLDGRSCPACWAKHGSVYDLDEPGPLDHQQGRCVRLPVTKSWADLGFDVDEPPSLVPDAETRFAALPVEVQRQILGPARYGAWVAGTYPMSGWAVRRSNSGWRDGFYVSPVPASGGRRSRTAA